MIVVHGRPFVHTRSDSRVTLAVAQVLHYWDYMRYSVAHFVVFFWVIVKLSSNALTCEAATDNAKLSEIQSIKETQSSADIGIDTASSCEHCTCFVLELVAGSLHQLDQGSASGPLTTDSLQYVSSQPALHACI